MVCMPYAIRHPQSFNKPPNIVIHSHFITYGTILGVVWHGMHEIQEQIFQTPPTALPYNDCNYPSVDISNCCPPCFTIPTKCVTVMGFDTGRRVTMHYLVAILWCFIEHKQRHAMHKRIWITDNKNSASDTRPVHQGKIIGTMYVKKYVCSLYFIVYC